MAVQNTVTTSYESDVIAWATEQADLLRARKFDQLDLEHIADEIEDVARAEERDLARRVVMLIVKLIKLAHTPGKCSSGLSSSLSAQRLSIARQLRKTRSLQNCLSDEGWLEDVWLEARTTTTLEAGYAFDLFPQSCPWEMQKQILQEGWLP